MVLAPFIVVIAIAILSVAWAEPRLFWGEQVKIIDGLREDAEDDKKFLSAMIHAKQAIEIIKKRPKRTEKGNLDLADRLDHLADLQKLLGEYKNALQSYEEALQVRSKTLGANHIDVAKSMVNVADALPRSDLPPRDLLPEQIHSMDRAAGLYREAANIQKLAAGPSRINAAETLEKLAGLQKYRRDYRGAMQAAEEENTIREQVQGATHPDFVLSLGRLVELAYEMGETVKARSFIQRAVTIDNQLPPSSTGMLSARLQLGLVLWDLGRVQDAADLISQPFKDMRSSLGNSNVDSRGSSVPWTALPLDEYISLPKGIIPPHESYAAVLIRKNLHFQQHIKERLLAERLGATDPNVRALLKDKHNYATGLAGELVRGEDAGAISALRSDYRKASDAVTKAVRSSEGSPSTVPLTHEEVCQRLPAGSTLLEYVNYWQYQPRSKPRYESSYSAFVIKAGHCQDITRVNLRESAFAIEKEVFGLRRALLQKQDAAVLHQARRLKHLIIPPELEDALGHEEVGPLIIAPDGYLAIIPFAVLPGVSGNKYLLESFTLDYITSGSELATFGKPINRDAHPDLFLLGDPDYDAKISGFPSEPRRRFGRLGDEEVNIIERIAHSKQLPVTRQTGPEATERWVRQRISGHVYIHLDTHGYSIGESSLDPQKNILRSSMALLRDQAVVSVWSDPLLFSGIALAGANHKTWDGGNDGILTAFEVTELDLRGTELVVLSACETGLGTIQAGSEVQGFRWAFRLAGATSLLTSLWKVPTSGTRTMMAMFYENLWGKQMGKAEALRQAQLELLKANRTQHNGDSRPADWAGWVLSGEWR